MANLNKVLLMGNLTRDVQLSYTPNNTAVAELGLAINRTWVGQDGQKHEETCFVDCQMYGRRAEVLNKYLGKGDPLFIEGRLKFDSWDAKDGTKRSKLRVVIEDFQFLGRGGGGGARRPEQGGRPAQATPAQTAPSPEDYSTDALPEGEDDIPF